MEVSLFVILLVAIVIALAIHSKNKPEVETRSKSEPTSVLAQPKPFDQRTAESTQEVLTGFAYIVEGDTITIKKTQIRLFGVDAPERDHPYGKRAKWALVSLCKGV